MFITKMSLPRRRFLQGVGTAFALPFLDAMVPAATALADTAATTRRFGAVFVPMGAVMDKWTPARDRRGLRVHADSEAARAVPRSSRRGQRHQRTVGRHAFAQRLGLPVGLGPQAHRSRRRPGRHDHRSDHRREDRCGHASSARSAWRSRTSPGTSAPATRATAARIRTRCRGRRRRCRCRWRPIRAWSSSGCSAGRARPRSVSPVVVSTPASWIRCVTMPPTSIVGWGRATRSV